MALPAGHGAFLAYSLPESSLMLGQAFLMSHPCSCKQLLIHTPVNNLNGRICSSGQTNAVVWSVVGSTWGVMSSQERSQAEETFLESW